MMLLTLSVPAEDWFTPIENAVIARCVVREHSIELEQPVRVDAAGCGDLFQVTGGFASNAQRLIEAFGVARDEVVGDVAMLVQVREQSVEQPHIAAAAHRQMQIGDLASHGPPRIDDHDLHLRPLLFRLSDALEQHRMTPGSVRADQHDQVRQLQIFVTHRHDVLAEGAFVPGDGG